jgi:NAD(P)-dependent dehydrogenase (short-subunit alcohol dehydrogenase family)
MAEEGLALELVGRVALVTGASRGIGRSVALGLAEAGADVCCAATAVENAESVVEEIRAVGRKSVALGCRVEDADEVASAFESAKAALGSIDILVNNAGIARPKPILDMTVEDWEAHMDINAKSVFLCCQQAARQMQGRGGAIINIGSINGQNAFPNRLAYAASKAAVHHMTRVMAVEWAAESIRVNCVAPGYVRTEAVKKVVEDGLIDVSALERRTPQGRLGQTEEIANAVVYLASDKASFMTGSIVVVDGGWDAYGYT